MELHKHFKLNSMLRYTTVILFIVSTTVKADITPKYDNVAEKLFFFDVLAQNELILTCKTTGKLDWTKNGTALDKIQHLSDKDRHRYEFKGNDLVIKRLSFDDDGKYICTDRDTKESAEINVVGKLAALWPFLGICAEVLVLCAIILIYEKRRNKEGMEESDTDQSPEQEKLKTGK